MIEWGDTMDAKKYLQQAYRLNELIEHDQRELERLRTLSVSIASADTTRENVQGGSKAYDKIGEIIVRIDEYAHRINCEIDEFVDIKAEIHSRIMQVQNIDARLILLYRYIEFMRWEDIAVKLGYTRQWVLVLHGRALKNFEEILKKCVRLD